MSKAAISRLPVWVRFWRDRRGVVAVAVAVLLPVLIGFAGIGIEVGLWFAIQRQNQSAADAAAISAALEYAAQFESGVTTNPTAAATTAANCNLFSTSTSSSNTVCPLASSASNALTLYPCYGFTAGSSCNTSSSSGTLNAVQVALTQPLNTGFANFVTAIWGPSVNTVNVTTKAIAEFSQTSTACLLALQGTGTGISVTGSYNLTMPNCDMAANSNMTSPPAISNAGGCIQAYTLVSPGGYSFAGSSVSPCTANGYDLTTPPQFKSTADPYAATLTHAFLTAGMPKRVCIPSTGIGPSGAPIYTYLVHDCIILGGQPPLTGTIILSPGTYWVTDGSLNLSGQLRCTCSSGGGVTLIFTTTQVSGGTIGALEVPLGANLAITLNAPAAGTYPGYLMVQDSVAGAIYPNSGTIGNAGSLLSGLIYFPNTNLSFAGNIQTDPSNCLVAVASSVSLTGNIRLDDSGCQTAGLTALPTIFSVFLADQYD